MNEQLNMELTKLISKAAIDGTLSENAVKQFTEVLEANKTLTESLQATEKKRIDTAEKLQQTEKMFQETHERLSGYLNREKELADRESQHEVLEMSLKYEQKRVEDHKSMVGLIFRNTLLKKQVVTPITPAFDQYNNRSDGYPQTTDVTEEDA